MLSHLTKNYEKDLPLMKLPETSKFQVPFIKLAGLLEEHGLEALDVSNGVTLLIRNCFSDSSLVPLEEKLKNIFIEAYENIEIKLITLTPQSVLPLDFEELIFERIRISDTSLRKNRGSFSAIYLDSNNLRKSLYFRFEMEAFLQGYKAKHNLPNGTILTLEALEPTRFALSGLSDFPLASFNSNSWVVKHYVREGTILLNRHLEQKPLVNRDDYVDALVQDGGLIITLSAKALSSGNKNDMVRIRTSEGRMFNALVISDSKVIIKE
ncbi:MAG: flagellar basal body P-ring formation protein FlgA [Campylobacteraceae bacterium]|nr:flagellar basal body P-ring formation protein FlgA [Campylobacteraceae bacterium]